MALTDKLSAIGNAIREKNGTSELIPLADMPQAILDIAGGSGTEYTSITYNNDDTITLIGTDGTEHTMVCTYEDNVLKAVTYDGKAIDLVYDGVDLVGVGDTMVDLSGYWYVEKRTEMEITGVITIIHNPYVGTMKAYDDMCIAGYVNNKYKSPFIVSETENGVAVKSSGSSASSLKNSTTVEYNNQIYYVRYDSTSDWSTNYTQFDPRFYACSSTEIESAVVELLDHYFFKDEVAE